MKTFVVISEKKRVRDYFWNSNSNKEVEHFSSRDYNLANNKYIELSLADQDNQYWIVTRED